MEEKLCHNSEMDELAKEKLKQMQDYCWTAQQRNEKVMCFDPREAYDIFTYLLIIMNEKQISIGSGPY